MTSNLVRILHLSRGIQQRFRYSVSAKMKSTINPVRTHATIQAMSVTLAERMGVQDGSRPGRSERLDTSQYLPKTQTELPVRSMRDSYLEVLIPLSTDQRLQDKYTTFLGYVRVGRLLEDMDIFAVMVAQKHILNPALPEGVASPHVLVTALADRIDFTDFVPKPTDDIKMSGHVTWVGRTSMEVVVWLEQRVFGTWNTVTKALFLIAARNPVNGKSANVNPLEPGDEREKVIFSGGDRRKKVRFEEDRVHVSKVIPDESEQKIVHDLYMKTIAHKDLSLLDVMLPPDGAWMSDWVISNTIFSQPENRNLHNTVFGGFIMRQATELSWVLGFKFSKYRPKLKRISDITFTKPIAVNSLIHMHAFVTFTQLQYIQIAVYVDVFNPQTGKSDTTNTVNFTYEVPEIVKEVYPRTYQEAMRYVDGRRHFYEVMESPNDDIIQLDNTDNISHKSKL